MLDLLLIFALIQMPPTASAFASAWRSSGSSVRLPSCFLCCSSGAVPARRQRAVWRYSSINRASSLELTLFASRRRTPRNLAMKYGGGSTDRYSWEETDKEINVKARMPAWAKGKSVMLDLNNNNIRLALKEEEDKPIIEGTLRGAILLDGSYWTMESLEDFGKMLYLTLEKAPHVTGLGPWMGVVVGEGQMDSDYPEENKAAEVAAMNQESGKDTSSGEAMESGAPVPTGEVDEDGFCKDMLTVQGMDIAMVARQVPADGNALFSAVVISNNYIETGQHDVVPSQEVEAQAKELRQRVMDFLTEAYEANEPLFLQDKTMPAKQFVAAQARVNSMAQPEEYLKAMRADTMWGGGGEVVGLTYVLRRPIHIYELQSTGRRQVPFGLTVLGKFGAPLYSAAKPIHLLSTYSKFPALDPGSQANAGNHYVALFLSDDVTKKRQEA
ncbi:unnamed protein product [Ascophyllum nodosum]